MPVSTIIAGSSGRVERWAFGRRMFRSLGNFVHPTLHVSFGRDSKAVGPFYLVSMPEEVKYPMQGNRENL